MPKIGIVAEYDPSWEPHTATVSAIEHSADRLKIDIDYQWISASNLDPSFFDEFDGLWVAPGSPYSDLARTVETIRIARTRDVPTLGTCGGFQHILIEYARNVLGLTDAQHAEYDPYASCLFVSELECSLAGREMQIQIVEGSQAADIYAVHRVTERYFCNFSVSPDYLSQLQSGPMQIVGSDAEGEVRIIELPGHPFFIGTLFMPQTLSTPENPHPLVNGFLKAVSNVKKLD